MPLSRRSFLKSSLAASAALALNSRLTSADAPAANAGAARRAYFELRCYHLAMGAGTRLKADADPALLDAYLERALLPALTQRGIRDVGVFTELDVDRRAATATPKAGSPVWVLIPHATLESFVEVSAALPADSTVQAAGAGYLDVPKATPAFERIDTWLYLAFAGMPQLAVPAFSRERVPTRIFEMRDYESHGELAALNKMAMFDEGEIALMQDLGMSPVFFGQGIAGPNLPHLRYVTSAPDLATHFANWRKFGPDPRWAAMRDNPRYKDNMTKATVRFLTPKSCSAI